MRSIKVERKGEESRHEELLLIKDIVADGNNSTTLPLNIVVIDK